MEIAGDLIEDVNMAGAEWLQAIARGDERALSTFYDATLGRCYALAMRITRRHEAAEDVVAETYLQVWREAQRYDPLRGRPLTWLLSICYSRAIDHLRRRGPAEAHPDPQDLVPEECGTADDPMALAMATQAHTALHGAIGGLPAIAQQLLGLAFFRGMSHQEIASHTGLPLGTVKTHLRQALKTLRQTMEGESP